MAFTNSGLLRSYKGLKRMRLIDVPSGIYRLLRSYKGLKPGTYTPGSSFSDGFITFL